MPNLLTDEEMEMIKDEAFKQGVSLDDILFIFGIILRDQILEKRSLSIEDIDKKNDIV